MPYSVWSMQNFVTLLMPPNFEEVEGAYWFGPVCTCVCLLRIAYSQERLELGSWNLIYGISMKNKRTHIFFSFDFCKCKPMEPCEQNIWRTAWADDLINFGQNSVNNWLYYFPFPILVVKQSGQQNKWRTAWARIMISDIHYIMQMTWLTFHKILWTFDWIIPLFILRHFIHKGPYEQNLSYDVAVIQWLTSCHKNLMTTRYITLGYWRVTSWRCPWQRYVFCWNNVNFKGDKIPF